MGNSDVGGNSDVWLCDRPRGVACDREMQGQKHAAHMLQACEHLALSIHISGRHAARSLYVYIWEGRCTHLAEHLDFDVVVVSGNGAAFLVETGVLLRESVLVLISG